MLQLSSVQCDIIYLFFILVAKNEWLIISSKLVFLSFNFHLHTQKTLWICNKCILINVFLCLIPSYELVLWCYIFLFSCHDRDFQLSIWDLTIYSRKLFLLFSAICFCLTLHQLLTLFRKQIIDCLIFADGSVTSSFWKTCFSCGEDPSQIIEGNFLTFFAFNLLALKLCLIIQNVL